MTVLVDQRKSPGLITSPRAERVLCFLESCAGASEEALALLFPFYRQSLRILRGSGYALRCWKPGGEVFWCPMNKPLPTDDTYAARCALGWLAARFAESGAELQGRVAVLKNRQRLRVYVVPPVPPENEEPGLAVLLEKVVLPKGWYSVSAAQLPKMKLSDCVRKM
ncbi:hypothetical protein [Desulforamulus ruminis]|uniref:Uncharacterized protein n=1 Tax=Desulforamulus ruminis (strain ATCC 23193 / DSM 2154 / NCIMB 8452 / DL) TaxID=696281 RepID=F6DTW2_DESRL|nr:hypothetical protein [Desulforamulus ruminis]AEG58980.1 hypothetical protein Desru_0695 [Desulforamulus ruminis DSM 2154]